jgi:hypothetical protein
VGTSGRGGRVYILAEIADQAAKEMSVAGRVAMAARTSFPNRGIPIPFSILHVRLHSPPSAPSHRPASKLASTPQIRRLLSRRTMGRAQESRLGLLASGIEISGITPVIPFARKSTPACKWRKGQAAI